MADMDSQVEDREVEGRLGKGKNKNGGGEGDEMGMGTACVFV